jgi:hypothetical protein
VKLAEAREVLAREMVALQRRPYAEWRGAERLLCDLAGHGVRFTID